MHIKFTGDLEQYEGKELFVDNLRQLIVGIKHHYGQKLYDKLISEQYKYVLLDSKDPESAVSIHPQMATMNFSDYDTIWIVPDVSGEYGGEFIVAAIAGAAFAASAAGIIIAAVINIAISIALSMLVNLLSPTPEFGSNTDPAQAQKLESSLFNGAPNIKEQGGSVPLIYGSPHCGGVLISTGISTEEKTV
jgi:predicted phage tail protein